MSELTDNPDFDDVEYCCEHGIGLDEDCDACAEDLENDDWDDWED